MLGPVLNRVQHFLLEMVAKYLQGFVESGKPFYPNPPTPTHATLYQHHVAACLLLCISLKHHQSNDVPVVPHHRQLTQPEIKIVYGVGYEMGKNSQSHLTSSTFQL